jgi:hypothetical protein
MISEPNPFRYFSQAFTSTPIATDHREMPISGNCSRNWTFDNPFLAHSPLKILGASANQFFP